MYYAKDIGFNLTVKPEILDEVLPVVRASAAGVQPDGDDVDDVSVGVETAPMANLKPLDDMDEDDDVPEVPTMFGCVGCACAKPACMATVNGMEFAMLDAKYAFIGAALGSGFDNTTELHVMNYCKAMESDNKEKWFAAMKEEHERMVKNKVWRAVPPSEVPKGEKIISSTLTNKKKSNGTYRAQLNARGFQQIPGVHYDPKTVAAPVTNDITIQIVMVLMIMANWFGELLNVKGAFLHGQFGEQEKALHDHGKLVW
jgi:hypothetical protein